MTISPLPEVTTPAAVRAKAWEHAALAHRLLVESEDYEPLGTTGARSRALRLRERAEAHAAISRALTAWAAS